MKKIGILIMVLTLTLTMGLTVFASVSPMVDNSRYLHDISDKLTDSEEKTLEAKLANLSQIYNIDAVMAFADTDYGTDVAGFTIDIYNLNEYQDNGVIFLVDMNNRSLEVWGFGTLHDLIMNKSDRILDDAVESMQDSGENLYAVGNSYIKTITTVLENWRADSVGFDNKVVLENGEYVTQKDTSKIILTSLAGGGLFGGIMISIMLFVHSRSLPGGISARAYATTGLALRHQSDRFVGTYTSRARRAESSSGGGGGISRGGSSGGRSGGGGSRSF